MARSERFVCWQEQKSRCSKLPKLSMLHNHLLYHSSIWGFTCMSLCSLPWTLACSCSWELLSTTLTSRSQDTPPSSPSIKTDGWSSCNVFHCKDRTSCPKNLVSLLFSHFYFTAARLSSDRLFTQNLLITIILLVQCE